MLRINVSLLIIFEYVYDSNFNRKPFFNIKNVLNKRNKILGINFDKKTQGWIERIFVLKADPSKGFALLALVAFATCIQETRDSKSCI